MVKKGFQPVTDNNTELLILGTSPGKKSLGVKEYYADGRNAFWRLISGVINKDITILSYRDRIEKLMQNKIGLWVVFSICEREGSQDSEIRNPVESDFSKLKTIAPSLRTIYFNGQEPQKYAEKILTKMGYSTELLPSSSGSHAIPFDKKLNLWKTILKIR
ncbi:MAG: DNA-deoxyinosine glycosylase [Planctomycetota bacterium]|nr:DNA-deoxyinosine glycosylase [Planctomycetota bacterium]